MRWLRIGAICKQLHVLPRAGGVLDQPAREVQLLETILDAFNKYEDHQAKKQNTRQKNRERHRPQRKADAVREALTE